MQCVHAVITEELYINARTVKLIIDVINNHVTKHLTVYMYTNVYGWTAILHKCITSGICWRVVFSKQVVYGPLYSEKQSGIYHEYTKHYGVI